MATSMTFVSKPITYTNTGTPLDNYRDNWKVFVVDKIWAGYKIYPILPNETERKNGRAISEALADALNNEFGADAPTARPGRFGSIICEKEKERNIIPDDVEEIFKAMNDNDREEWYTYRVKAMEREWNGTLAKDEESGKESWVIKPEKLETVYVFCTIGENTLNSVGQAMRGMVYRQRHWTQERKRTFKGRENNRRGGYSEHPVYNNGDQVGDWRYWGGENPLFEGIFPPLTPDELLEEEDRLGSKGLVWEIADYIESDASY
ncbi:hypothetical protein MMC27_007819 [Xylographa pallens]|nr:hypothetical protein [Xylographa pallens]